MSVRGAVCGLAITVALVPAAGCGEDAGSTGGKPQLKVSAASSLKEAFSAYAAGFEQARAALSFAGSDELAAQIRQGAQPDVFASADTKLPDQLFAERLVERPVVFTGNELVLAVPAGATDVRSLSDAAQHGLRLAIGDREVPIGRYTREVLGRLGAAEARAILANVRSEEPDVKGIVGKLSQRAVDAGFVYATDVRAAKGVLRSIRLANSLQPRVAYGVAVVKASKHATQARAFIDGLLHGDGRKALAAAGFRPPPPP
jgi:molybdate transport system substrate-binding protein